MNRNHAPLAPGCLITRGGEGDYQVIIDRPTLKMTVTRLTSQAEAETVLTAFLTAITTHRSTLPRLLSDRTIPGMAAKV